MKNIKKLLLGSAASLILVAGVSQAEAVSYTHLRAHET